MGLGGSRMKGRGLKKRGRGWVAPREVPEGVEALFSPFSGCRCLPLSSSILPPIWASGSVGPVSGSVEEPTRPC